MRLLRSQGFDALAKAAWSALGAALEKNGFKCATSHGWREVYKYWESFESENDLTELQMEIV